MTARTSTARAAGFLSCLACGMLSRPARASGEFDCPRCGVLLLYRKEKSLQRTWALLVAAAILYVPANVLPIMHTTTLAYNEDDTILSGVVRLWASGAWPLALLVFSVSIVVPCLKLMTLTLLLVTTQRGSLWRLHERAQLYRAIEYVGRWSMLDLFVVALLVGLVQLRGVATIRAEAGAIAFAAVVILTMYATQAFDPRLMWDRAPQ